MSISTEKLTRMIQDEYLDAKQRLELWVETAEEELKSAEKPRPEIYEILLWTQNEFHRRRVYLNKGPLELERRAVNNIWLLEIRGAMRSEAELVDWKGYQAELRRDD